MSDQEYIMNEDPQNDQFFVEISNRIDEALKELKSINGQRLSRETIILNSLLEDKSQLGNKDFWNKLDFFPSNNQKWKISLMKSGFKMLNSSFGLKFVVELLKEFHEGRFEQVKQQRHFIIVNLKKNTCNVFGLLVFEIFPTVCKKILICSLEGPYVDPLLEQVDVELIEAGRQLFDFELLRSPYFDLNICIEEIHLSSRLPESFLNAFKPHMEQVYGNEPSPIRGIVQSSSESVEQPLGICEIERYSQQNCCEPSSEINSQFHDGLRCDQMGKADFEPDFNYEKLPPNLQDLSKNVENHFLEYLILSGEPQSRFNCWVDIIKNYLLNDLSETFPQFFEEMNIKWNIKIFEDFKKEFDSFSNYKLLHYLDRLIKFAKGNMIENKDDFFTFNSDQTQEAIIVPIDIKNSGLKPVLAVFYFELNYEQKIIPWMVILGYKDDFSNTDLQIYELISGNRPKTKPSLSLSTKIESKSEIFSSEILKNPLNYLKDLGRPGFLSSVHFLKDNVSPLKNLVLKKKLETVSYYFLCSPSHPEDEIFVEIIIDKFRFSPKATKVYTIELSPNNSANIFSFELSTDNKLCLLQNKENFVFESNIRAKKPKGKNIKFLFRHKISLLHHMFAFLMYSIHSKNPKIQNFLFKAFSKVKKHYKRESLGASANQEGMKKHHPGRLKNKDMFEMIKTLDEELNKIEIDSNITFQVLCFLNFLKRVKVIKQYNYFSSILTNLEINRDNFVEQFKEKSCYLYAFKGLSTLLTLSKLKLDKLFIFQAIDDPFILEAMLKNFAIIYKTKKKHLKFEHLKIIIEKIESLPSSIRENLSLQVIPLTNDISSVERILFSNSGISLSLENRNIAFRELLKISQPKSCKLLNFLRNIKNKKECVFSSKELADYIKKIQLTNNDFDNLKNILIEINSNSFFQEDDFSNFILDVFQKYSFKMCYDKIDFIKNNTKKYLKMFFAFQSDRSEKSLASIINKADQLIESFDRDIQRDIVEIVLPNIFEHDTQLILEKISDVKNSYFKQQISEELRLMINRIYQ